MKAFDRTACRNLAEHFLGGVKADLEPYEYTAHLDDLARAIQEAIEAWFDAFEKPRKPRRR